MKYIRSLAIALCLTLLLPLAACGEAEGEPVADTTEAATVTAPTDTLTDTPADTLPETDAPVPPPPLPTLEDLQAGYTYDWDPNGYTMDFEDERGQFRVQEVHEIWADHLMKYRDIMNDHEAFGDYVLYQPDSGPAALPELSVKTDPAFFEAGNTYELTFTTLTYSTEMRLWLVVFTENGRRMAEEIVIDRGTTPVTVTYTVAEGDIGIGLDWMTDWEPLFIGDMRVKLTLPEDSGQ